MSGQYLPIADSTWRLSCQGTCGGVKGGDGLCWDRGWHIGQPPDRRAVQAAAARGYDLSDLRARQIKPADFARHDLILVMDRSNLKDVEALLPKGDITPVRLFSDGTAAGGRDIPDPYYTDGFDQVLDLIETCADDLLQRLRP